MRCIGVVVLLVGCKGSGNTGEPGAFDPPFENTTMTLLMNEAGASGEIQTAVTGSVTVGTEDLPVLSVQDSRSPTPIEVVASFEGTDVALGGFTIPHTPPGIGVEVVFSQAFHIDMEGPIGQPQTATLGGELTLGDPSISEELYLPFDITATVLETDVVAPAPMGDVPGCRHASVSASSGDLSATGEVWTRDDVGFVHGFVDTTWGRFDLGELGYKGFDDVGDRRVIQAEGVVQLGRPFSLSTYDIDGDFLADKDTHAQMWLEMRWANAERARTEEQPLLSYQFGTVLGTYPAEIQRSDVSLLHASESEGFVYWYALVDQAAKNEADNGIAYQVSAWNDGFISDDVLVGAFIRYKRIP